MFLIGRCKSAMDSLKTVPSAEYASLLALSPPNEAGQAEFKPNIFDRNQNLSKLNQEHIYAQLNSNGQCYNMRLQPDEADTNVGKKAKIIPNKMIMNATFLLRSPTVALNHTNGIAEVKRPHTNLPNICQTNYDPLNTTKEKNSPLIKKSEPNADVTVFSISGRRVIVSSGFNVKGSHKQINTNGQILSSNFTNEWHSKSTSNNATTTKLQVCTDCFSLCLFVPGTVLCILSPWLLVPIYIIPSLSNSNFQTLVWISCIGSAILVFMGCMVGNMVWYRKGKRYKCRLHCGRGPKNHYWGDSLTAKRNVHTV